MKKVARTKKERLDVLISSMKFNFDYVKLCLAITLFRIRVRSL